MPDENITNPTSDEVTGGNNTDNATNPTDDEQEVDLSSIADMISDRDKKIDDLNKEIAKLKKANTEMLLHLNAGQHAEPDIEKTIIDFCDTRKVGRPT